MTTTVPLCHCARCRVEQAGLGPGPYTPAQYAKIAPATVTSAGDDPFSQDPGVLAAQLAVREAREQMEADWKDVVKANDRLRDPTLAARMRAVEAERD